MKDASDRIELLMDRMLSCKERGNLFIHWSLIDDNYYHYLMNDWIPKQKDATILTELFVLVNFNVSVFTGLVYSK